MDPITLSIIALTTSGLTLIGNIVLTVVRRIRHSECCGGEIDFGPESPEMKKNQE